MTITFISPGPGGYGTGTYGATPYGGGGLHDNPSVSVTSVPADNAENSASSLIVVNWVYVQPQGVAQAKYRVKIVDHNGSPVYYDTGWLTGTASTLTIDALLHGIPTDVTQLDAVVSVQSADGPSYVGTSDESTDYPHGFDIYLGDITPVIVLPVDGSSQLTPVSSIDVTWTGEPDDNGNHIAAVRVRLLAASSTFQYADSGFLPWDWTSDPQTFTEVYPFVNGTHYRFGLTLRNTFGVTSSEVYSSFWYLAAAAECVALETVGTLYEVAINGQGMMLFDANQDMGNDIRTELLRRTRDSTILQAPRLATTQTPFNEAIERYTFFGSGDFRGGTGQLNGDRTNADDTAFSKSYNVNPFEKGKLSLLLENDQAFPNTYVMSNSLARNAVAVNGTVFTVTDDNELSSSSDLATWTPFNVTTDGSTAVFLDDLATDGTYWYAACLADGVLRGGGADPAAVWGPTPGVVRLVRWAAQRICIAYDDPADASLSVFSTLTAEGAEEVVGGRFTITGGITDITAGDGFVWFSVSQGADGVIYKWDLTAGTPSVAWQLPVGQQPVSIFWYQGQVMVRAIRVTDGDPEVLIYTAPHQSGNLVPSLLCNLGADSTGGQGTFGANDRFVFFSASNLTVLSDSVHAGLGAIDLSTGGYCAWNASNVSNTHISAIFEFNHKLCFAASGNGFWSEVPGSYVSYGFLNTSIHDGGSTLDKVFDRLIVRFQPLPDLGAGNGIYLYVTYDEGNTYLSAGPGLSTPGQTSATFELGQRAQSGGIQIEFDSDQSDTPIVELWQLQCHPTGKADLLLQLPIDCGDYVSDLNGRPLPENGDGAGARRARYLESLMASTVCVQDIDWFDTETMEDFELDDLKLVEVPGVIKEKQPGVARVKQVALLTLRKSLR